MIPGRRDLNNLLLSLLVFRRIVSRDNRRHVLRFLRSGLRVRRVVLSLRYVNNPLSLPCYCYSKTEHSTNTHRLDKQLAYKPLNTPVIKQMRALSHRGWVALDGLDVLPEQGFAQFELFTGRRAPRRLMRAIVLEEYKAEEGHDDPSLIQSRLENLDGQST